MSRIYIASSWRNPLQPNAVETLREEGHEVYDFRNPGPGEHGFSWSEIDPNWKEWSPYHYRHALNDPIAVSGYGLDFAAMRWADTFVLLLPCNRSAHIEAGWAVGAKKRLFIVLPPKDYNGHGAPGWEPELMYRLALEQHDQGDPKGGICLSVEEVAERLKLCRFCGQQPRMVCPTCAAGEACEV